MLWSDKTKVDILGIILKAMFDMKTRPFIT